MAFDENRRIVGLQVEVVADFGAYVSQFMPFVATLAATAIQSMAYAIPAIHTHVVGAMTNTVPTTPIAAPAGPRRLPGGAPDRQGGPRLRHGARRAAPAEPYPARAVPLGYGAGLRLRLRRFRPPSGAGPGARGRRRLREPPRRIGGARQAARLRHRRHVRPLRRPGPRHGRSADRSGGGVVLKVGTQTTGRATRRPTSRSSPAGWASIPTASVCSRATTIWCPSAPQRRLELHRGGGKRLCGRGGKGHRQRQAAGRLHAGGGRRRHRLRGGRLPHRRRRPGRDAGAGRRALLRRGRAAAGRGDRLPGRRKFQAHGRPTYPNGTHVCEVEVDPETGVVELLRYVAVDDFGVTVNPLLADARSMAASPRASARRWPRRRSTIRPAASC